MILAKYKVKLKVRDRLLGGIPKHPEMIEGWLRGQGNPEPLVQERAKETAKTTELVEEEIAKAWTTFKGDEKSGYYIEGRQIKAMMKDVARHAELTKSNPGIISNVSHSLEIEPGKIVLSHKIDGFEEKAIHVMTPQGPRNSLKRSDYINSPTIAFTVLVGHSGLNEDVIKAIFEHAETFEGLGSSVSQGEGKFDVLELKQVFEAKEKSPAYVKKLKAK